MGGGDLRGERCHVERGRAGFHLRAAVAGGGRESRPDTRAEDG